MEMNYQLKRQIMKLKDPKTGKSVIIDKETGKQQKI